MPVLLLHPFRPRFRGCIILLWTINSLMQILFATCQRWQIGKMAKGNQPAAIAFLVALRVSAMHFNAIGIAEERRSFRRKHRRDIFALSRTPEACNYENFRHGARRNDAALT